LFRQVAGLAGLAGCSKAPETSGAPAAGGGGGGDAVCPAKDFKDPGGSFALKVDPVLTKVPEPCITVGKGENLAFSYNGPEKEKPGTLSYQAYYVDPNGAVLNITGGSMMGDGAGNYTMDAKFSTSGAQGRPGFLEIFATTDAKVGADGITGTNKSVGLIPVKYAIAP